MDHSKDAVPYVEAKARGRDERSGEETVRRLREEREAQRIALRENIREAQGAIASAGFAISDQATPLEMVEKLLARNADQKVLEDGLRERLKAAEGARVIEADTRRNHCHCPFRGGYHAMFCLASYDPDNGYDACRVHASSNGHCRLDEGPILVKKAEAAAPGDDFVGISKAVLGYVKGLKAEEDSGDDDAAREGSQ